MPENTCTRLLKTALTPAEHIERAESMAQKMKDIASLEDQLKAASAGIKSKIVTAKKEMKLLGDIVAAGTEEREIECRIDKDWERKEIVVVRLDTNEVIERRTMTASEAQADLLDRGAAPGKLLSLDGGLAERPEGTEGERSDVEHPAGDDEVVATTGDMDAQEPVLTEEESANLRAMQEPEAEEGEEETEGAAAAEPAPEAQAETSDGEVAAPAEEAPTTAEKPKRRSRVHIEMP